MKDEEIEVKYWKMKEREQEKARKAKEEMLNWMMLDHEMKKRRKREQQQKERDQLKKMNPLTMHDSRATYIRPTTTSSYQLKKSLEYKTDNREQGYWETSSRGGTASKTHYSSSSASQVSWACPSKPSRAMTSKTPPKQPHPPSNRLPGRR